MSNKKSIIIKILDAILMIFVLILYPLNLLHFLNKDKRKEMFGLNDKEDPRIARGEMYPEDIIIEKQIMDFDMLVRKTKNIFNVDTIPVNGYFVFYHINKRKSIIIFSKSSVYFVTKIDSEVIARKPIYYIFGKRKLLFLNAEVYESLKIEDFIGLNNSLVRYPGIFIEKNDEILNEIENSSIFKHCLDLYFKGKMEEKNLPLTQFNERYRSYGIVTVKTINEEMTHNIIVRELDRLNHFLDAFITIIFYLKNREKISCQLDFYNYRFSSLTNAIGKFELIEKDIDYETRYLFRFFNPEIFNNSDEYKKLVEQRGIFKTYKYNIDKNGFIDIEKFCNKIVNFSTTNETRILILLYNNKEYMAFGWNSDTDKESDIKKCKKILDIIEGKRIFIL